MRLRENILIAMLVHGGVLPHASAQSFMRRYDALGQDDGEVSFSIESTSEGEFVVIGAAAFAQGDTSYYDPVLLSLLIDENGDVLDRDTLVYYNHAIYPGWANCMNGAVDGSFVSGGSTYSQSETQRFALWRISANGHVTMLGEYGPEGDEWIGRQAIQTNDGGFLLAGETGTPGSIDAMLIKTDATGTAEWERSYGTLQYFDYFLCAATTADDDGFFAGGQTWEPANKQQFWVLRVDAEGDTVWSKVWGSAYDEYYAHLTTKANGNPIVANSWAYGPMYLQMRAYMTELDASDGSFVWQREYGSSENTTELYTVKEVAPGEGHIAVGFTYAPNSNFIQGLLLRTADNGDSLWMRSYFYYDSLMTDGLGELKDVVPTNDGGFIACGYTFGSYTGPFPQQYSQDTWIVKVDSLGCIIPGCDDISTVITVQATNLKVAMAVYPNPARGGTTVKVALPSASPFTDDLRLRLVSSEGKEVLLQRAAVGLNEVDVQRYASGVYYLHLTSGSTWLSGTKLVIE